MKRTMSADQISAAFSRGKRYDAGFLTLLVNRIPEQHDRSGRVAFVAGKKMGNAVWRNASKRRMREVCRALGGPWAGYHVVFIARHGTTEAPYSKVLDACDRTIRRITGVSGQ